MTNTRVFGYADPLCARAGGSVDFMISADGQDHVTARLARVLHGDENPDGPGYVEVPVDLALPPQIAAGRQFTQIGSFARAADPEARLDDLASFTLFAHVFPTLPKAERQQIMGRWSIDRSRGFGLGIDPDRLVALWLGDGSTVDEIRTEITVVPRCWYFVAASFDGATKKAELHLINCVSPWNGRISTVVPFQPVAWVPRPCGLPLRRRAGMPVSNWPRPRRQTRCAVTTAAFFTTARSTAPVSMTACLAGTRWLRCLRGPRPRPMGFWPIGTPRPTLPPRAWGT